MGSANQIRVLLVDDDVRVRQTLRSILKPYSNIEVIGEASDGDEAVTSVGNLRPTVVVMDISMKKMDGITAARLIKAKYPDVLVLGCSAHTQEYTVYASLRV
jgi:DNA-binding NarL/FixJ family response regulator